MHSIKAMHSPFQSTAKKEVVPLTASSLHVWLYKHTRKVSTG